ncbi:RICIN domain-containing protein [Streptomyces sp. ME19-01-6]|uniref:RICIN domain-containing protein n=1 Tax=Streptomyces sp. ME19-01-6 TaxID=3028686 RepID=UPI0029A69F7A|nr:RICIN domain-containing protein [Streptomyces sp. ME19-01-6]MDX3225242.1 RICIN domain-containing protein [Streptomyces sp. ME19-01-6]
MPSQEPTPPKGPVVRRAVTLPGTAGTPDPSALTPLGTESTETGATDPVGKASAAGAVAEAATAEQPKVSPNESTSAGESAESVTPGAAEATAASAGATAASEVGAPDIPAAPDVPPAEADGHADGHGSADAMTSTVGDYPPGADTGVNEEDEPPSGRPTKALLAAAAIAGALLISLPFLAFGADDDDHKTEAAPEPTSGMTVPKSEEKGPGRYAAQSPAPSPTKKSESPSPETKPRPEPSSEQPKSRPEPEPEPSSEQPKSRAKKVVPASKPYLLAPEQRTNFQLKNVTTGRCADLPGMGKGKLDGAVLQHDCLNDWDADNQVWDFVLAQKGKGPQGRNLVVIKNRKSGLCLDLPGRGSQPSRTGLNQTYCNRTLQDNQLWWVENRGGNRTFWIHNYASDQRCLEVWGEKPDFSGNDARLGIYTCSPTDDHEWRLMSKGQS